MVRFQPFFHRIISSTRSCSQKTGPTLDTKRRKLAVMMGTERGSRVVRRACGERGFGVAMAEAMMLAAGRGGDAARSIWGTRARADFAGESGAEEAQDDARGSDVIIFVAGARDSGLSRTASAGTSTYSNVAIVVDHKLLLHRHTRSLMSTLSPLLLPSLNALLAALALPFALDHPTDLTPSLLLAIFESLISARLPIPSAVRQSRTRDAKARAMLVLLGVLECDVLRGGEHSVAASNADDSVLGAGGVSVDGWVDEIGLGDVDPERLADGGWEETIFVGELLCWLARRKGILPRTSSEHRSSHPRSLYSNHHSYCTEEGEGDFSTSLLLRPSPARPQSPIDDFSALSHITDVPRHPLVHSPEPSLSASATTGTDLSIRARSVSSRTSVSNTHDESDQVSQDTVQMYDHRQMMQDAEEDDDLPPTFRPRCIHELEDPSYIRALGGPSSSFDPSASHESPSDLSRDQDDEQDNDDPYAPPTPTPRRVRLTGWIDPVDPATEFSHFAASRAHSRSRACNSTAGLGPGPQPNKQARTGELFTSTPRLKTDASPRPLPGPSKPRRVSPSPSPSPPPASSKHPPPHSHPSPPPSPHAHSDPPFDVSFSTFNNTSTPAKPRPPRRPQFQTTTPHEIASDTRADRGKGGGSAATAIGPGRRRDRSPSYTPSPPSFGSLRSAGAGTRGSSGPKTRAGAHTTPAPPTRQRSTSPSPTSANGKSPPVSPPGSTATTNTLLTERARLLTELAALKRARAASGARMGSGSGRRVGVGV